MNTKQADKVINEIHKLAASIEHDEELKAIDERYSVAASWCDIDIDTVSL